MGTALPLVALATRRSSVVVATPLRVAALVAVLYAVSVAGAVAHHRVDRFSFVGHTFAARPGTSHAIAQHAVPTSAAGYDGQFALYIALDPAHAAPSVDKPAYRYSHIAYPIAARVLALGNDDWVPIALLLVNVLAVFAGTLALAAILRREGRPAWWAGAFGLFPGALVAFDRDLGDLLAYSLVALGVLALRWGVARRVLLAGLLFALAGLARESTLFFPAILSVCHLVERGPERRRRGVEAVLLACLSAAPYAAWRLFVVGWLGTSHSVPSGLAPWPFAGFVEQHWDASAVIDLLTVLAPGLLLLIVVLRAGSLRSWPPLRIAVVLQLVVFIVFLPAASYADYYAAGRLQLGTVVAALCCAPLLRDLEVANRRLLAAGIALALAPALFFAPVVLSGTPV